MYRLLYGLVRKRREFWNRLGKGFPND